MNCTINPGYIPALAFAMDDSFFSKRMEANSTTVGVSIMYDNAAGIGTCMFVGWFSLHACWLLTLVKIMDVN